MPHTIRTDRLLLRPPQLRDARAFARTLGDPEVTAPTKLWPYPLTADFAVFMLRQAQAMVPRVDHTFLVFEAGRYVGSCGIHQRQDDVYAVGYMIGRDHWGRGIATEALRAVCAFGFRTCRARRIIADVFKDNPASIRVLEKMGMRCIGDIGPGWSTTRQANFPRWGYAMTRTEFRP